MLSGIKWQASSLAIASLVLLPLIALLVISSQANMQLWQHLSSTVLPEYVRNSLLLMLGVSAITLTLGVGSAWLVTQYRFPGIRFFDWALLLPLAMPAYISAYSYTGLLDVAGPIQTWLRDAFGWSVGDYWFPPIRSLSGAVLVMGCVLYPYVYLLARSAFLSQSQHFRDVAALMGYSRRQAFMRITLPIARPAVIAGLSLALMETLADYGTVAYFGVNTFTTGIFRTWFGMDSVSNAAQLALVLLGFVVVLLIIERRSRQQAQYYDKRKSSTPSPKQLTGVKGLIAVGLVSLPIALGFVIPVWQLLIWAVQSHAQLWQSEFWRLVLNTVSLASVTAVLAVILGLLVAYAVRTTQAPITRFAKQVVSLGYAVPGTIIAVATLVPLAKLDNLVDAWFRANLDISTGLILSGTLAALIIAYLVRFMAVALGSLDAGLQSIAPTMDQAAQSMGSSPWQVLRRVHIPMLKGSLLTALLLVFVDVMKELPATLIMRPFNFNTLAVRAYEYASDERLADASLASLAIICAGLIPVILLTRAIHRHTR